MCKEICKEGQQAVLDYFGNKVIVGNKGATTYSFKEPTMPKKAWRLSSSDSFPSSTLFLSDASDTSCELAILSVVKAANAERRALSFGSLLNLSQYFSLLKASLPLTAGFPNCFTPSGGRVPFAFSAKYCLHRGRT